TSADSVRAVVTALAIAALSVESCARTVRTDVALNGDLIAADEHRVALPQLATAVYERRGVEMTGRASRAPVRCFRGCGRRRADHVDRLQGAGDFRDREEL